MNENSFSLPSPYLTKFKTKVARERSNILSVCLVVCKVNHQARRKLEKIDNVNYKVYVEK